MSALRLGNETAMAILISSQPELAMSNSLAIAAVTATLQNILFAGLRGALGSGNITALPIDKARSDSDSNQINLFLYHTVPNPAWRNRPKRTQVKRGISAEPPLGLDLYYAFVAYGKDDDEVASHQLLGRVMSIFHDRKQLNAAEIGAATAERLPHSNLHQQIDSINIVPQSLSFDEMAKIWQLFQVQYRPSVFYQVSVVILDSVAPVNVALPVLPQMNGKVRGGSHPVVNTGIPRLQAIVLPNRQRRAHLGNVLTLRGALLNRPDLSVRLRHPLLREAIALPPLPGATGEELRVQLPDRLQDPSIASRWLAGIYTLSLVIPQEEYVRTSEELPLAIAPQVVGIDCREEGNGLMAIELACVPQVRRGQEVLLLLGDRGVALREAIAPEDPTEPSMLTFWVRNVPAGDYVVRLRVDGADSIPVDFATKPLGFAENQRLSIQN
ncbi:MAG: DUF4255 domain-containing protein [Cyanobacteria bacterium SBLK]|nr:DUF4255 domain-containing protein [Cyanobacteria bacterium SBLK]